MKRWRQYLGGALLLGMFIVVGALIVTRPRPALPNPNGHDRLLALAEMITREINDLAPTNAAATAQFARQHADLLTEVQAALKFPALVPLTNASAWMTRRMPELMSLRRLEKAVLACARDSAAKGDSPAAAAGFLAAIKLGQEGTRGGLMIDFMVGSATQMNGLTQLSNSLPRLNAAACELALAGLSEIQARQEPLSSIVSHERHWILLGSEWWKSWETAKELPAAYLNPAGKASLMAGTPADRWAEVQRAYAGTESALRLRLVGLMGGENTPAPR